MKIRNYLRTTLFLTLMLLLVFTVASCGPDSGNDSYTVTLSGNGGTPISKTVTVDYGDSMPGTSKPSRNGYTFLGYYDSQFKVSGTKYYNSDMSSARDWDKKSNGTLYAIWG